MMRDDALEYFEEQTAALDALAGARADVRIERGEKQRGWSSVTLYSAEGGIELSVDDEQMMISEVAADGTPLGTLRLPLSVTDGSPEAPRYPLIDDAVRRLYARLHVAGYV